MQWIPKEGQVLDPVQDFLCRTNSVYRKKRKMKVGRNDPCWCGSGRKYKQCHMAFDQKLDHLASQGHIVPRRDLIKTQEDIVMIREAAKVNRAVLDEVAEKICEGMPTSDIDRIVAEKTASYGAVCAPLNYEGFPYSVCTSVNDQVCHGFPSENVILKEGDIINVDCTSILNGKYADSSRMFMIGQVSEEARKLVEATKKACDLGLEQVKPWGFLGDVGQAVNDYATSCGYQVVREIGGHGVGNGFHEDPWVGFTTRRGSEMVMAPGLMFTIEPMINAGSSKVYTDKKNGWEIYTLDGSLSAQWEYQVLVTEDGYEMISW